MDPPSADVEVSAGEMLAKTVSCLLCGLDFARQALKDHIACEHLNYVPHRCRECGLCCVNSEEMFHHAVRTGHGTVLNERTKHEYTERIVEQIYCDCVNASERESFEAREMVLQPVVITIQQVRPFLQVPRTLPSSTHPVVKQQEMLASPFATTTRGMPPPRVTTAQQAEVFTEVSSHHVSNAEGMLPLPVGSNHLVQPFLPLPNVPTTFVNTLFKQRQEQKKKCIPNQCQLCQNVVEGKKKKKVKHAREEHLRLTQTCPVSGCGFEVTSSYPTAVEALGTHVRNEHGFINLTSAEMATFKETRKERKRAVKNVHRDCFL